MFTNSNRMQRTLLRVFFFVAFVVVVAVARWIHAPLAGALVGFAMWMGVVAGICRAMVFFHRTLQANNDAPSVGLPPVHDTAPTPHAPTLVQASPTGESVSQNVFC